MQEFKGTPGPWHVMRGDVLDKNGRMVASVEGFCPGENDTYDADLIASAPELPEALQGFYSWFNRIYGDDLDYHEEHPIAVAKSAIAKALGK